MDKRKIAEVKKAGAEKALKEAISQRLWTVKHASEHAERDNFKSYQSEIDRVRKALDDADQLWKELYTL